MAKDFRRNSDGHLNEQSYKELKNIIKLYDELRNVKHTDSRATLQEIQAELDLREKLSDKIKNKGIKNIQDEEQALRELYATEKNYWDIKKQEARDQEKLNRLTQEFNDIWSNDGKKSYNIQVEMNKLKADALKKATKLNTTEKQRQKIIEDALKKEKELENKYNKQKAKEGARDKVIDTLLGDNFVKNGGMDAVKNGTYGLNMAVNIFASAVNMFKNAVKEGIDKNYNATEKYYNSITASNSLSYGLSYGKGSFSFGGRNYSGYKQINNAINDQLSSEGLLNNISNTDVLGAAATLTSSGGFSLEAAIAKGYQDTVIKYIVPYLDTSTDAFNTLEYVMPGISKNVAATALSVKDQYGENQYIAKYSSQLVELMTPVALQANKELYSAQYQEIAQQLEARVANKEITAAEAQAIANEAFAMYRDPVGTLQNGNVISKISTIDTIRKGGIDNPAAYVTNYLDDTSWAMGLGGDNTIAKNAIANAMGISNFRERQNISKSEGVKIQTDEEQLELFQKQVGLADDLNTTTDKTAKLVENATADISDIKTLLGDKLWSLGEMVVAGITGYIGAKVIGGIMGKGIGALAGSAAGGTGAGLLAAGGGIALGVAAGLVITKAIDDAAHKKAQEENSNDEKRSNMKAKGLAEDLGISEGVANLEVAGSNIYDSEENWAGSKFDNYQAAELFGAKLGMFDILDEKDFIQTMDAATSEADTLKYNKAKIGRSLLYKGLGTSPEILSNIAKAWMIGLYSQGYSGKNANILKALEQTLNVSFTPDEASMLDFMGEFGALTRSQFNSTVKMMKDADMWLWNDNGKWVMPNEGDYDKALKINGLDAERVEWLNSHRYGLNSVPYDGYPALLHQGEAVLTATTANTLRTLLDEYKATNHQTISFDTIIQNQTLALVTKMDEIIKTISSNGMSAFGTSTDKANGLSILNNSLTHITSTKSM